MAKLAAKYKLNDSQLAALRQIVPEAFKDNELDFNSLYEALSDYIDDDEPDNEQYGLSWPGKRAAKRAAAIPPSETLIPAPGDGVDEETTRNIYIEGDNLEVLKIIRKAYEGRIKMIYIDPPYNTGSDFIYLDDFSESVESFQRQTGQVDQNDVRMTTNNKSDGRFHSKWLSMMYPRLRLARDLLSEDGVIFISIDDNEVDNLKKICNEVFGEENFAVCIPWQSRLSIQNDTDFSVNHEYIFAYAKNRRKENRRLKETNEKTWFNKDSFVFRPIPLKKESFDNTDNDMRGLWKADPFDAPNIRPNLTYPITNPNTGEQHFPPKGRHWRISQEKFTSALEDNRIVWGKNGMGRPQLKVFYEEKKEFGSIDNSWFSGDIIGTTTVATKELQDLFENVIFDTPKPISMIHKLCNMGYVDKDSIILDFFSGSSTTAHAVMQLNAENGTGGGGVSSIYHGSASRNMQRRQRSSQGGFQKYLRNRQGTHTPCREKGQAGSWLKR